MGELAAAEAARLAVGVDLFEESQHFEGLAGVTGNGPWPRSAAAKFHRTRGSTLPGGTGSVDPSIPRAPKGSGGPAVRRIRRRHAGGEGRFLPSRPHLV